MSQGVNRGGPLRWAVLTVGFAVAVGLSAYWTALASRPVEAEPAPQPRAAPPGLVPIGAGPERNLSSAARDRAYRRGRRAGFREGRRAATRRLRRRLAGFLRWEPGAAYVVTSAPDGNGIATRAGPLEPGASYGLCRDRRRVCVTKPD